MWTPLCHVNNLPGLLLASNKNTPNGDEQIKRSSRAISDKTQRPCRGMTPIPSNTSTVGRGESQNRYQASALLPGYSSIRSMPLDTMLTASPTPLRKCEADHACQHGKGKRRRPPMREAKR